jgi:hypothetical protein
MLHAHRKPKQTRPADPIVQAKAAGQFVKPGARIVRQAAGHATATARGPPGDDAADDDADAYSIVAFCKRHALSPSFYFKIRAQGLGPAEMRIGARVLISREAAARWRAARESAATA